MAQQEVREFTTSMDSLALGITVGVFLIVTVGVYLQSQRVGAAAGASLVLLYLVFLIVYLLQARSYVIDGDTLIIRRPIRSIRIPLSDITSYERIGLTMPAITLRLFGSGGLFGWLGIFWNRDMGTFKMYARNRQNRILLHTRHHGHIVISPDDVEMMSYL